MKMKPVINTLIICAILLILYFFAGHDFAKFFFGGKAKFLQTAEHINVLCNTNESCPEKLAGWQVRGDQSDMLYKDSMIYILAHGDGDENSGKTRKYLEFRLVYRFFIPDHWFEAQGGVGKTVASGWKSR